MQDLSVIHRHPLMASGINCLAPGLGFYYLGLRREAWLFLALVLFPWFALLLFPWPPKIAAVFIALPLLSLLFWLITMVVCWRRAGRLSPMIRQPSQRWQNYGLFWLAFLGLGVLWLALVLLLKVDLALYQVKGNSMAGTLDKHDWVVIATDRRVPTDFHRGDIVLLLHPETNQEILLRVAALPGERVTVHGGGLFIDGHWQAEYYVDDLHNQQWIPEGVVEITVPDNQLFVLADNRDDSRDSRYWGTLPADRIIGKQVYRLGEDLLANYQWLEVLQQFGLD